MNKRCLFICLIFIGLIQLWAESRYSLVKIKVSDQKEIQSLIYKGFDIQEADYQSVSIIAKAEDLEQLIKLNYHYEIIHEDLTKYYQSRLKTPDVRTTQIAQGSMGGYFTYNEAIAFVDSLQTLYPHILSAPHVIGQSVQGRDILAYKISDHQSISEENERKVLITGLHHAREAMTLIAPLYYMQWLVDNYNTDPLATFLVNNREIWFVPVLNVDGYIHNETNHPDGGGNWRKNMHDNNNNGVFDQGYDGVDLNRNYGFEWEYNNGSTVEPPGETYKGASPFSEPETQAIRDFCIAQGFKSGLNFHSYSGCMIYSEHANGDPVPDTDLLQYYGLMMTKLNGYSVGSCQEMLHYQANGTADDWMYGEQNVKPKMLTYSPEIGFDDGFWPPTDRIIPLAISQLYPQQFISLIAGSYLKISNSRVDDSSSGDGNQFGEAGESFDLYFSVKNLSWCEDISDVTAILSTNDPLIVINEDTAMTSHINALTEAEIRFNVSLSNELLSGHSTHFSIQFTNSSGYDLIEEYEYTFGSPLVLFYDDAENGTDQWICQATWNTTDERSFSGLKSFTDSPYADYPNSTFSTMMLNTSIDLSEMNGAYLGYQTRWNLNKAGLRGKIEVKVSNNEWIPLAGEYSSYNTHYQGIPLYQGIRDYQWLNEKVKIPENQLTNPFKFRFSLQSSPPSSADGIYFDEIFLYGYTDQDAPPFIAFVTNITGNPDSTGPYPIKAVVSDAQCLSQVMLKYNINNSEYHSIVMTDSIKHVFQNSLPIMNPGSIVNYYISASDDQGNVSNSPTYTFTASGTNTDYADQALDTKLHSNYPNPFNPETMIHYSVKNGSQVQIDIYNIKGQRVLQLINKEMPAGTYQAVWDGRDQYGEKAGSGVYFCVLKVNQQKIDTIKMLLIK